LEIVSNSGFSSVALGFTVLYDIEPFLTCVPLVAILALGYFAYTVSTKQINEICEVRRAIRVAARAKSASIVRTMAALNKTTLTLTPKLTAAASRWSKISNHTNIHMDRRGSEAAGQDLLSRLQALPLELPLVGSSCSNDSNDSDDSSEKANNNNIAQELTSDYQRWEVSSSDSDSDGSSSSSDRDSSDEEDSNGDVFNSHASGLDISNMGRSVLFDIDPSSDSDSMHSSYVVSSNDASFDIDPSSDSNSDSNSDSDSNGFNIDPSSDSDYSMDSGGDRMDRSGFH